MSIAATDAHFVRLSSAVWKVSRSTTASEGMKLQITQPKHRCIVMLPHQHNSGRPSHVRIQGAINAKLLIASQAFRHRYTLFATAVTSMLISILWRSKQHSTAHCAQTVQSKTVTLATPIALKTVRVATQDITSDRQIHLVFSVPRLFTRLAANVAIKLNV